MERKRILIPLISLLIAAIPTLFAVRSVAEQISGTDLLVTESYVEQAVTFQPVFVPTGKTLSGKCEFILRSGIADMTAGMDIQNGVAIQYNHSCNIPRDDGRGVTVQRGAWFMLRGSYRISD